MDVKISEYYSTSEKVKPKKLFQCLVQKHLFLERKKLLSVHFTFALDLKCAQNLELSYTNAGICKKSTAMFSVNPLTHGIGLVCPSKV